MGRDLTATIVYGDLEVTMTAEDEVDKFTVT